MGRKKIEIKFIPSKAQRNATYRKRSDGLMRKVNELVILCGAVATCVLISDEGKVWEYDGERDSKDFHKKHPRRPSKKKAAATKEDEASTCSSSDANAMEQDDLSIDWQQQQHDAHTQQHLHPQQQHHLHLQPQQPHLHLQQQLQRLGLQQQQQHLNLQQQHVEQQLQPLEQQHHPLQQHLLQLAAAPHEYNIFGEFFDDYSTAGSDDMFLGMDTHRFDYFGPPS